MRGRALANRRLEQAKSRLDTLDWYPRPVSLRRVRLIHARWLFRLPWLRRFDGYATWGLIAVREPTAQVSDELIVHELCHVWQLQHAPLRMPASYLTRGYADNPFERQARAAARLTALSTAGRPPGV